MLMKLQAVHRMQVGVLQSLIYLDLTFEGFGCNIDPPWEKKKAGRGGGFWLNRSCAKRTDVQLVPRKDDSYWIKAICNG